MFTKIYEYIKNYIKNNYGFLIVLTLLVFVFYYEFPYVIYKSGGTINLEDRIIIDKDYEEKGSLSMSYVTAMKGRLPFIILSFIIPDWDLISLKEITDQKNYDEVLEIEKVYLNEGIDNAIISAFRESRYSIEIEKETYRVIYITDEAQTNVKIGDELVSVFDNEINSIKDLRTYINSLNKGDVIKIIVNYNGKTLERSATIYEDEDGMLKIGIAFKTNYVYKTEIPVTIKMKDNEYGSSGGLMMSLAIYNALTKEDITKGLNIVGTGTIESDGTVGEIGGVKYKVLAAHKNKADIFFCPEDNYEEAMNIKKKRKLNLEIVKVKTLKEAINYLNNR